MKEPRRSDPVAAGMPALAAAAVLLALLAAPAPAAGAEHGLAALAAADPTTPASQENRS
jgi:hypothetical protein